MLTAPSYITLDDREQLLAIGRRHWSTTIPGLILAGVLIVTPFFFLFTLLHQGALGSIILAICLATGAFSALKTLLRWQRDVLLVTNRRLIDVDQRGVWSRTIEEAPFSEVQELKCERTGFGDVVCRTSTLRVKRQNASDIIGARLVQAEKIARMITEQRETQFRQEKPITLREELIRIIKLAPEDRLLEIKELLEEQE